MLTVSIPHMINTRGKTGAAFEVTFRSRYLIIGYGFSMRYAYRTDSDTLSTGVMLCNQSPWML